MARRLLILTGAGASRLLSRVPDEPLPLMQDWAERLRARLGPGLAGMSTLDSANTGLEFEQTLGALFAWELGLDPMLRFAEMARGSPETPDVVPQHVRQGVGNAQTNMAALTQTLHESLFDEFGPERLDDDACQRAYSSLLELVVHNPGQGDAVVFATTNYDRSIEIALGLMDVVGGPRTGFTPHPFRRTSLDPSGLGEFRPEPSVVYLHGAVGWYVVEQSGESQIESRPADEAYNSTLGRPAVLYPDPTKEIERAETALLWGEFTRALKEATHVLVIGHQLNDPYLLDALKGAPAGVRVGYVAHADERMSISDDKRQRAEQLLPGATVIPGEFGPQPRFDQDAWVAWLSPGPGAERDTDS